LRGRLRTIKGGIELDKDINQLYNDGFTKPVIRIGRWTLIAATVLCFIPSIYLGIRYGAMPPIGNVLSAWFLIASIYGPYYFVEPISYFPVLGIAGTYMSFLAGEIGNMRLPVSAVAQNVLKVEPGSKKAELVSTLAIAGSILTSVIAGTLAVLAGSLILGVLPPFVIKMFDFVLPGVFGSMFAMFALKAPKYGVFSLAICILMQILLKTPVYITIPVTIFSTIGLALYNTRKAKANNK
jgi:hypothetical protein